jgi:hypothetical protein
MSFRFPYQETPSETSFNREFNDAEKGQHDSSEIRLSPLSKVHASDKAGVEDGRLTAFPPVHEGNMWSATQSTSSFHNSCKSDSSLPILPKQKIAPPPPKKQEPRRSTLFVLWFNTYKRLFTFVVTLNLIGIILTSVGQFQYAQNHLGAMVLGNLLFAILMRNELFFRILYMVFIYGLRSVCQISYDDLILLTSHSGLR